MIKIVRSLGTTYSGIHNVLLMECIQNKQYFARAMIPTVHFFCFVYSRAQPDDSLYKAFCMRQPDSKMLTYILYALGVMWILYVLTLDSVPGAAIDGADYSS